MELLIHYHSLKELFAFRENIMFAISIMEKGDKPKDMKPKDKKPKEKKVVKAKAKQTQKQEQKQSVKIVIGEKAKPKRKYARKAKVMVPSVNIVRGQTAVSYLGGEGDLNQVITGPSGVSQRVQQSAVAPPRGGNPPPQPPVLSSVQAPATLDAELTAVSEISMPKARTPAFSEVQEEVPKKKTKAKAKSTIVKIGEGIGDFIKKNLLDQPLDLHTQEPSRAIEKPRPPLVIQPESKPMKPGKAKAEDIYMEVVPIKKPVKGKTDVPVEIFVPEPKGKELPSTSELVFKEEKGAEEVRENTQTQLIKEKAKKKRKEKVIEDTDASQGAVSMQDPEPITKEELNQSLRRMIVGDTIDDIISTIETPIFSTNPDFKTISQNVDVENVPATELDFGNEGLTQFNIDGFVPVGRQEGMVEVIEKKKGGRPRKYETEEEARQMKAEQTRESNKRMAEEKKNAKKWESITEKLIAKQAQEKLNQEYEDFVSVGETTDMLRVMLEQKREEAKQIEEGPYSFARQFPNSPQIQVAQDFNPLGEYAGSVLIQDVARKMVDKRNAEAYDGNFISGDFQEQSADLWSNNNFGGVKSMIGDELGYSDENPVLTNATFSKDAVDSNLPFLGISDIEFV